MKVAVTGATGTIGRQLVRELLSRGDEVTVLSRDAARARQVLGNEVEAVEWADPSGSAAPAGALSGRDAVVHLLGERLDQRWSDEAKQRIRESRELGTRNLVEGLRAAEPRPGVLVSQSAVGFYGPHGDEPLDESAPAARGDFLAEVVVAWEDAARQAEQLGMRVVTTRTGVVLSDSGGALSKMMPPFKLGVGGPVAGGKQYLPWIHAEDAAGALRFLAENPGASGPVNVVAPEAATNKDFSKALGRALKRPALLPVPSLAIKALYGEMGQSTVINGQNVVPKRLQELGYEYRHPELDEALRDAVGR